MTLPGTAPADGRELPVRELLDRELRRVVDRLRGLPVDRLGQPAPPWPTRAEAARGTAQQLLDLTVAVDPAALPPGVRLPVLAEHAAPDQLAVAGLDLLRALTGTSGEHEAVARRAHDALVALRRAL